MKTVSKITVILLALLMMLTLVACNAPEAEEPEAEGAWATAIHLTDKTFGDGAKTVTVVVKAEERALTFTLKTDKALLGEALEEHDLIEGKEGPYGIFITAVNGITVSDAERTYWALYKDGAYSMTGVDTTPIADGDSFELVKEGY